MMTYRSDRNVHLTADIDFSRPGLEYGPLTCPIIPKSWGPVLYIDYTDTETLKAKGYRGPDPDNIVDVDIVWGQRPLHEFGQFHYAIASHVIEHIPDMIGWLKEIVEALTDDGIIALAIPDKRYTFDKNRPLSTTGEVVEAWLEQRKRPSMKQIFDHCRMAVEIDVDDAWRGLVNAPLMMGEAALQFAFDQSKSQLSAPTYIDSHCWTFTPSSFLDILEDLVKLGILPLEIDALIPTAPGTFEFIVRLRRAGPNPLQSVDRARLLI